MVTFVRVRRYGNSFAITVPRQLVKAWKLRPRELLAAEIQAGRLVVARVDEKQLLAGVELPPRPEPAG